MAFEHHAPLMGVVMLALVFLGPGMLIARLVGETRLFFLASVIYGYAWVVGLSVLFRLTGVGSNIGVALFVGLTSILMLGVYMRGRLGGQPRSWRYTPTRFQRILATVAVCALVYLGWVGVYDEVPSDYYRHLEYFWQQWDAFGDGALGTALNNGLRGLGKGDRTWYVLNAGVLSWMGAPPQKAAAGIALYHGTLLLCVVSAFTLHQVARIKMRTAAKVAISFLATTFFVLHFGIDIFSYLRYYGVAPTIGAFPLYLGALAFLTDYTRRQRGVSGPLVAGVAFFAAAILHLQEALFIAVVGGIVLMLGTLLDYRRLGDGIGNATPLHRTGRWLELFWNDPPRVLLAGSVAAGAFAAFLMALFLRERASPREPWVIPVEHLVPFARDLYILNPTFQLYLVVTIWGMLVLGLYWLFRKELESAIALRAGMVGLLVMPLNPFFVDFYLRFGHPTDFWRVAYTLPLFAIGSWLFVRFACVLAGGRQGALERIKYGAVLVLLIMLLFPVEGRFFQSTSSKIAMLAPVASDNSWRHWSDLVEFFNDLDPSGVVLTDPVTGYVLSATTPHSRSGAKFFRPPGYFLDDSDLSLEQFAKYPNAFVVINKRNGGWSYTGEFGGHWASEILMVGNYYNPGIVSWLQVHSEQFTEIWYSDQVWVFRVQARD